MEATIPYDSNGNFGLDPGYRGTTGQTITVSQHNPPLEDIASGLSQVLLRSGVAPMGGPLNMNSFRIANVANATADGDAVNKSTFDAAVSELGGRMVSRSTAYTAIDADYNTTFRFTAGATLSIADAATLRSTWYIEVWADGGPVVIDPDAGQTISGLTTITVSRGQFARIWRLTNTTLIAAVSGGIWGYKGIGEVYMVDTSLTGVDVPPVTATDVVYIELTAGLTGVGQFNNGKLTSESVTGTAPLVLASAVVSVAGSPMNGQTVRLLNSEGRILRPGAVPGTLQDDAFQGHWFGRPGLTRLGEFFLDVSAGGTQVGAVRADTTNPSVPVSDGVNGTPRTATETRMKNVSVKAYMRVK